MPYDIIAIDIDGTLLTSDRNISERTLRAVRDAELAGKNLVLCTGRSFNSGRATAEKLPASTTLVFHSGALILDSLSGPILRTINMKQQLASELVTLIKHLGHDPLVYESVPASRYIWYEQPRSKNDWRERYLISNKNNAREVENLEHFLDNPAQIIVAGEASAMNDLKIKLEDYKDNISIIFSLSTLADNYWCVEILPSNVTKANALAFLCKYYCTDSSKLISIGDNFNDLDMIKFAGLGVAMGNAPKAVQKEANLIAPTNNCDGVAYIIENYLL
tara:strand:- start:164376 stop:165203 length:828 start_codon:yes stop_codon:yes gene_type:complete